MSTTIDSSLLKTLNASTTGSTAATNTTSAAGTTSSTSAEQQSASQLRSNFMTMLVTQLKNQDPLNPTDNAQLTSQLAQINTLSGIEQLNTTMQGITGQIDAGQALQASALIGRHVLVPGDRVLVGSGTTTPFGVDLAAPADKVKASIYDGSGKLVRQIDLGALKAGAESFTWDGTLDDGSVAPNGAYRVAIAASTAGQSQAATVLNYAQVAGVSSGSSGPLLDLGATQGQIALQDARKIL